MRDKSIGRSLELGVISCLKSVQKTNPDILLSSSLMKETERDIKHLPAIAAALASIICRSDNDEFREEEVRKIQSWGGGGSREDEPPAEPLRAEVSTLGPRTEARFRHLLEEKKVAKSGSKKGKRKRIRKDSNENVEDDSVREAHTYSSDVLDEDKSVELTLNFQEDDCDQDSNNGMSCLSMTDDWKECNEVTTSFQSDPIDGDDGGDDGWW